MYIIIHFSYYLLTPLPPRLNLNVGAGDRGRAGGGAVSQDLAALLNVNDGGTTDTDAAGSGLGRGPSEGDGAKVSKRNQRAALLEVLDDPFSIGLAEVALGTFVREGVCNLLSGGVVRNDSSACGLASCGNGHSNGVTSRKADSGEVIGVVWVPLIPSIISDGRAGLGPVNTGLENGSIASVTVNANPGGTRSCGGWGWDSEGAGHTGVARSNEDGTSPVGAVFHVGLIGHGNRVHAADWVPLSPTCDTLSVTLSTHGSARGGDSRAHEEQSTDNGGELHDCKDIMNRSGGY